MRPKIYIQGMHGMGDSVHQRAVLRQILLTHDVLMDTSWPSMYYDLVAAGGLTLIRRPVALHSQTKNAQRETALFKPIHPTTGLSMRIRYGGGEVLESPSKTVLEAMCNVTGTDYGKADYSLDVPDVWTQELFRTLGNLPVVASHKPWLVYRPLVARPEWRGGSLRNADQLAYANLFQILRDTFFVISVADLEPGKEWIVGPQLKADLSFHHGELSFPALAALFKHADVVYTSSGFAAILGPAVGTPTISIVGGYESVGCHDSGARFAPYIAIGPKVECGCWTSQCHGSCDRTIDMDVAAARLRAFLSEIRIQISDNTTPFEQMFNPAPDAAPIASNSGQRNMQMAFISRQMGLKA